MPYKEMVLFSGGVTQPNKPFYHYSDGWVREYIKNHFIKPVVFVPYALWGAEWGIHGPEKMYSYAQKDHWGQFDVDLIPLHEQSNKIKTIENAGTIIVGGGSVHTLMQSLLKLDLLPPIREKIYAGTTYVGTSAGSLITGPTIATSNEPPILQLSSYEALGVLPFQIATHYYEAGEGHHNGPTPKERVMNYLRFNPNPHPVLGLPDGTYLHVTDGKIINLGQKNVTYFSPDVDITSFPPNTDLTSLLYQG